VINSTPTVEKFILKESGKKRFAYPTKQEAFDAFKKRTLRAKALQTYFLELTEETLKLIYKKNNENSQ